MARIVGSTFKPGIPARAGQQETAMDRALASFVSPQGVALLAQGIGALGKLPFQSKDGGLGLMERAARSRNQKAQNVLQQAKALNTEVKSGASDREVQEQRDVIAPYEGEEVAAKPGAVTPVSRNKLNEQLRFQGQREGETPEEFKARFEKRGERTAADVQAEDRLRAALEIDTGKPSEDRAGTAQERRMLDMIEAAKEADRNPDDVNLAMMSEEALDNKLQAAFRDSEFDAEELASLSMDDLMGQAVKAQEANRNLRKTSRAIQNVFAQELDPMLVQRNVEASVNRRRDYTQKLRAELKRRAVEIQSESATQYIEGKIAKQLAGLDPVEQKAELRRLAKSVQTQEDKDEVMSLAARFKPVRSTVADYFTSDDALRSEFEEELSGLLPTIDPLADLKKQSLETQIALGQAQAGQIAGSNETKLEVARIGAGAKQAAEAGKAADKRAAKGREARAKERKRLEAMTRGYAQGFKIADSKVKFMKAANKIINGPGNFQSKYQKIDKLIANDDSRKALDESSALARYQANIGAEQAAEAAKQLRN